MIGAAKNERQLINKEKFNEGQREVGWMVGWMETHNPLPVNSKEIHFFWLKGQTTKPSNPLCAAHALSPFAPFNEIPQLISLIIPFHWTAAERAKRNKPIDCGIDS